MMLHLTFAVGLSDLSDFMGFVRDRPDFFKVCYGFVMVSLWFRYGFLMIFMIVMGTLWFVMVFIFASNLRSQLSNV